MASVAVEIFDGPGKPLDYAVPNDFAGKIFVGSIVEVPLRNRRRAAVVVSVGGGTFAGDLKPIAAVVGNEPVLSGSLMELARWTAAHYGNQPSKIFKLMVSKKMRKLPAAKKKRPTKKAKTAPKAEDRTGFLQFRDG